MASEKTAVQLLSEIAFRADHHQRLKRIQWRQAPGLIDHLVSKAAGAYRRAMVIVGTRTELWEKFSPRRTQGYDPLVLLEPYRVVAAHYRFAYDRRGQLYLISVDKTQEQIFRERWTAYFYQETRRLLEWTPPPHRLILQAVAYDGSPDCERAVQSLTSMLRLRYRGRGFPTQSD